MSSEITSFEDLKMNWLVDYALGRIMHGKDIKTLSKYALNSSELLSSETDLVKDYFFKEEKSECETREESST